MKGFTPTQKELEVVKAFADNLTRPQVAKTLLINERTVDGRIYRLRRKLGLKSLAAVCVHFYRQKWID